MLSRGATAETAVGMSTLARASPTEALHVQADITRSVVQTHELSDVGEPGERWNGAVPATLERVLIHLLQEYARHVGHLDVVRELVDGKVGE